nr:M48 family metalloprotease [Thermomicrobium sp. CFH 73360]
MPLELGPLLAAADSRFLSVIRVLLALPLSRYREFIADHIAALVTGSPRTLASALVKMDQALWEMPSEGGRRWQGLRPLLIVAPHDEERRTASWLSTHPPVHERVRRLVERRLAGR